MADAQAAPQIKVGQDLLPVIRQLEDSNDDAISPRGAIGRYQIMPGTARGYGFDPAKLRDPAYNEKAAATILNDLYQRYRGNTVDTLAAYNSGEGTTDRWIAGGRKDTLPPETVGYLSRAQTMLQTDGQPPQVPAAGDGTAADRTRVEPKPLASGRALMQKALNAGYANDEVVAWKDRKTQEAIGAGYAPQDIAAYWGDQAPDPAALDTHFKQNYTQINGGVAKVAESPQEMFAAGWDMSVAGLRHRRTAVPSAVLAPDAGIGARVMAGAGQVVGDLPEMVMGFAAGAPLGGALATAVAGPEMAPVGVIGGAWFGAGALPQASREILINSYRSGDLTSAQDYLKMAGGSIWRTAKAGLVNAAAGGVGGTVRQVAGPVVGNVLATGADITAQAATMTALDAGFAGQIPDAADFASAAVLMLGMHTAATVAGMAGAGTPQMKLTEGGKALRGNLEELYKQTGIPPWLAVKAAREDPLLMQELMASDPNGEPVFTRFRTMMNEPDAFQSPQPTSVGINGGTFAVNNNWMLEGKWVKEPVVWQLDDGSVVPAPEAVASYLKRFGELAGFKFNVGPAQTMDGGTNSPQFVKMVDRRTGRVYDERQVYIPDTPDELSRRWYGLGASEVIHHEVGHAIDQWMLGNAVGVREARRNWSPDLAREIKMASQMFAPKLWERSPAYRGGLKSEQFADAIAAWISNPPIRKLMPQFTKTFKMVLEPFLDAANRALPQRTAAGWERAHEEQVEMGGKPPVPPEPPQPPGSPGSGEPQRPQGPQIDLDPTMHLDERMLNEIANEFIGEGKRTDEMLDPAYHYRQWVSELGPARTIDKMLAEQGFDRERLLGLEDMFRQTYGTDGRVRHIIFKGGIDPITLNGTKAPPVTASIKMVKENGGNLNDWINYMVAQRALDKAAQGKETGHTLDVGQLQELVAFGKGKYQGATESLQRTFDSVLDYARDSGIFSQEQIDAMRRDNPIYISFRRLLGDEEFMPGPKNGRRGFRVREPVTKFEGDDRRIMNPLIAAIDNIGQIVRMADRNRAVGSAVGLIEVHGDLAALGVKRIGKALPHATLAEPGSDVFKPYDIADPSAYEPLFVARANRFGGYRDNQFIFFRDGKAELWEAKAPSLARLMRGADTPGEANLAISIAQGVAAVQRTGIVTALDFPLRNTWRDQVQSFIADPLHPPPFISWIRGAMEVFTKSDKFWDWNAKGGAGMAMVEMDRNILQRDMNHIFEETGTWDGLWNTVRHPLEAAQMVSALIDESSRVGYAKHAESQGIDPIKATTMSRKAYLDFTEKATHQLVNWWARFTPFMRPNILALKQAGESMTGGKAKTTMMYALASVTAPVLGLYVLNTLQDEFLPEERKSANLPRWQKDTMYVLPEVNGVRIRLPGAGPFHVVFGGLVTRFLDSWVKDDPRAFKEWASTFIAQLLPPMIPAVALPVMEQWGGRSWFSGHKLIPAYLEGASGEMQYTENTTEVAKKLAQVIAPLGADASPIIIENYVRQWTGTLGVAALKAMSAPFKMEGKPWEMTDLPFVQSFLIRHSGMNSQPVQDFFSEREEIMKTVKDQRLAMQRAGVGANNAEELDRAVAAAVPTGGLEQTTNALYLQRVNLEAINNTPTVTKEEAATGKEGMTREEKLHMTDIVYQNMILTAKNGLGTIRAIHEARKGL